MKILLINRLALMVLFSACGKIEPAEMVVQPTSLNFGETETSKKVYVVNTGDERLDWRIDTSIFFQTWIDFAPASGTNDADVTISINRENLSHGSYKGELSFISNGGNKKVEIILIVF